MIGNRRRTDAAVGPLQQLEDRLAPAGLLVAGAPAGLPEVRVLDASSGAEIGRFLAFDPGMRQGVRVAVGDINGDGADEIAVGAGAGRGRVRVVDGATFAPVDGPLGDFLPFGPDYRGGVHLAIGDVDRDGRADLIVGADGAGRSLGSLETRVFSGADGRLIGAFRAPGGARESPFLRGGVRVAAGDLDRDGRAEVVTATGRGFRQELAVTGLAGGAPSLLGRQTLTVPRPFSQAFVAAADADLDRRAEVFVSRPGRVDVFTLAAPGRLDVLSTESVPGARLRAPVGLVDLTGGGFLADPVLGGPGGRLLAIDALTRTPRPPLLTVPTGPRVGAFVAGTPRPAFDPAVTPFGAEVSYVDRLGQFDPADGTFKPVGDPGTFANKNVYVVAHGWAPGWRDAVDRYAADNPGGYLKWWQTTDPNLPDRPSGQAAASAWMFGPTANTDGFVVSPVGFASAITGADPDAVVIAYSWIDQSATAGGFTEPLNAYQSEAFTYLNGLKMAGAVEAALGLGLAGGADPGRLHVLGHSHGSKVATVAAARLAADGYAPAQLSTLDSPEDGLTVIGDSANFNWFYMPALAPGRSPGDVFVDNYVSEFGIPVNVFPGLSEVVDVTLNPDPVFGALGIGEGHSYAAAWYAGSGLQLSENPSAPGLGWSPLIGPGRPVTLGAAYEQPWSSPPRADQQFVLSVSQSGPPTRPTRGPEFSAFGLSDVTTTGSASLAGGVVSLATAAGSPAASLVASASIENLNDGLVFDLTFSGGGPDDLLSIALNGDAYFFLTGDLAGPTTRTVALNYHTIVDVFGETITFSLTSSGTSDGASVSISDPRQFRIENLG